MLPSLSLYNWCSQIVPVNLLINPQYLMNPPPGAKPGGPSTSKPRLSAEPTFGDKLVIAAHEIGDLVADVIELNNETALDFFGWTLTAD